MLIQSLRSSLLIKLLTVLLISFQSNAYAKKISCNSENVNNFIGAESIEFIDITTLKSKKWSKNYFKALKSPGKTIVQKYKKRFGANLKISFKNGLECTFPAKIRISGDYKEHIASAPPIASLDVKLLAGNVNSIIRFKLFIPSTKGSIDEVFSTALLDELGFLAPKTYLVPSTFNGQKTIFLYQEKISKEFIELNHLREAPILEGDERFIYSRDAITSVDTQTFDKFGLARIINKNWAKKGLTSLAISKLSLEQLNKFYIDYLSKKYFDKKINSEQLRAKISSKYKINKGEEFKAIMLAIGAEHALWPHNRNFYYDPIYEYFRPIYYDGNSTITKPYKLLIDHSKNKGRLNNDEVVDSSLALKSLNKLDRQSFNEKLKKLGLEFSLTDTVLIIEQVVENLKKIKNSPIIDRNQYSNSSYFSNFKNSAGANNKKLVFSTGKGLYVEVCNFSLVDCHYATFSIKDYSELLEGRYIDNAKNSYIFIGSKHGYINKTSKQNEKYKKVVHVQDDVRLVTYGSSTATVSTEKRMISLNQTNVNDRFLIKGGALKDWKIKFTGLLNEKGVAKGQRFNQNLLTGCLTLMDINVDNVSINIISASCEDGVNLVRVDGNMNNITVKNTVSDAIDADFSEIFFKNINIEDSGNDCIDLSSGNYNIKNANLSNCKDKAISVGEKSKLIINSVTISKSNIGIAAKDSSIVEIGDMSANLTNVCLSAYNKKQEFWGGYITLEKHNCNKNQFTRDQGSLIKVLQ